MQVEFWPGEQCVFPADPLWIGGPEDEPAEPYYDHRFDPDEPLIEPEDEDYVEYQRSCQASATHQQQPATQAN